MIKIKKLNIFVLNQEIRVENFNELYEVIYFIYSEKIKRVLFVKICYKQTITAYVFYKNLLMFIFD